ncbi:MAG: type VI secretion system accessory protein TagJ [Phycisphaerales bacterium]|jgi:type VI secretion system protein ImpE
MTPQDLLKHGKLDECLKVVEGQVRASPADAKLRVLLFQVLAVMGDWDRATIQLGVVAEMDPASVLMAQMCQQAILSEKFRADVFSGKRAPMILGEPEPWMGMLVQAAQLSAQGKHGPAQEMRDQAFELAPAVAGEISVSVAGEEEPTKHAFEWIADADELMGPMLELFVGGKYYWVPWSRIALLKLDAPTDLRDGVWLPGQVIWTSGGTQVVLVPVRYPGSEAAKYDGQIRLARRTEFVDLNGREGPVGQRLLATDAGEFGILDCRSVRLGDGPLSPEGQGLA